MDKDLKDDITEGKRFGNRIIVLQFVLGEKILYAMITNVPQVGLDDQNKKNNI